MLLFDINYYHNNLLGYNNDINYYVNKCKNNINDIIIFDATINDIQLCNTIVKNYNKCKYKNFIDNIKLLFNNTNTIVSYYDIFIHSLNLEKINKHNKISYYG
jgi:hypothetical protein